MITTPHKPTQKSLPPGWRYVKLGDVCKVVGGSTPDTGNPLYWDGTIVWVTPTDLGKNTGVSIKTSERLITSEGLRGCRTEMLPIGTVVMSSRAPIGHLAIADIPLCTNQGCKSFVPSSNVDSGYLYWSLKQSVPTIQALGSGATFAEVSKSAMQDFEIPLPPLPEQQRIAGILKKQMAAVDKARLAAEARLAAVKALPAAFLRQVFGVEPVFTASPVTPQKPMVPGWKWHRLTDLARLATGHTPSRYHKEYWQGDIPWLQLADIRVLDGHEAQDTAEHTNALGLANSSSVLLPKDTVCMSRTASVGFFTVMGRPMCTSQDFVNWVCGDTLAPWFLLYLLIASREKIRELGSGAVHKTIYFPAVRNFSVCVPPLAEQRRMAVRLKKQITAAETARAAAEAELAAINALPATLLRRAFSGEL